MAKPRTILNIALTAALCVVAPHLFARIVGYWALLMAPTIQTLGITSRLELVLTIGLMNALGALLAAAVMSVPFGWLVRGRVLLYGGIVGVVTSLVLIYWAYVFVPPPDQYWPTRSEPTAFGVSMRVVESLSFIVGCMYFSLVGARLVRRPSD